MPGLAHSSVRSISRSLLGTSTGVPSRVELTYHGLNKQAPSLNGVVKDETVGRGTDRPEEPGRCLDFGANHLARLSDIAAFDVGTGDITVSLWIKTTSTRAILVCKDDAAGSGNGVYLALEGGQIGWWAAGYQGRNSSVNDDVWHHVVAVKSGSTVNIYIDGRLDGTGTDSRTLSNSTDVTIGNSNDNHVNYDYIGKLSDVQAFPKALSASEVSQLYTIGLNTDRIFWLKLEEGSGDYCYDSSGNNNTATLAGHTSAVRYTGSDVPTSGLNKVGYTLSDGVSHYRNDDGTGLIPAGAYIPRDESNKAFCAAYDVAGEQIAIQYVGEAPKNGQLENSYCRVFDGVDDVITLNSEVPVTGTDYTYGCWVKTTEHTKAVSGRTGDSSCYTALLLSSTVLAHKCNSSGSNYAQATGLPSQTDGEWHHWIVRRNGDGNNVDFFVDGVKYPASYSGTLPNNPHSCDKIGVINTTIFPFDGSMASWVAFDRALTDDECGGIYTGTYPSDPVAWLPLSDSHQDSAVNVVDPANSGTPSGHNSSFVGLQSVFAYNAARGSTKYTHATSPDIIIPLNADGTTATYTPPAGYTKDSDRAPSPGVWPLSENTLNSNPNNAPRRDWSIGENRIPAEVSSWSATGITKTLGQPSPDGNNNAVDLIASTSSTAHFVTQAVSSVVGLNEAVCLTVFAEYSNHRYLWLAGIGGTCVADLQEGVITNQTALTDGTILDVGIQPVASGLYRIHLASSKSTSATAAFVGLTNASDDDTSINTWVGDDTSKVRVWGAKLEAGSQPTAYIPPNYDPNEPSDFTPNPPELLEYRSEFDNAYWTKTNATVTANSEGVADTLLETSATGAAHVIALTATKAVVSGKRYIHSVEVKPAGRNHFALLSQNPAQGIYFDLTTQKALGALLTLPEQAWVDTLVDGWFRVNMVVTATSSLMNWQLYLSPDGSSFQYNGDITKGLKIREASLKRYHPTNPLFFRQRTDAGKLVGIDRLTNYKQPLLGGSLSRVQNFVTARTL